MLVCILFCYRVVVGGVFYLDTTSGRDVKSEVGCGEWVWLYILRGAKMCNHVNVCDGIR